MIDPSITGPAVEAAPSKPRRRFKVPGTRDDLVYAIGLLLVAAGAALVYLPAAPIVAGAGMLIYATFLSSGGEPT